MIETELYSGQAARWPRVGRHVLAQYDDASVVVYQAYKRGIAEYAVKHGRFGEGFGEVGQLRGVAYVQGAVG